MEFHVICSKRSGTIWRKVLVEIAGRYSETYLSAYLRDLYTMLGCVSYNYNIPIFVNWLSSPAYFQSFSQSNEQNESLRKELASVESDLVNIQRTHWVSLIFMVTCLWLVSLCSGIAISGLATEHLYHLLGVKSYHLHVINTFFNLFKPSLNVNCGTTPGKPHHSCKQLAGSVPCSMLARSERFYEAARQDHALEGIEEDLRCVGMTLFCLLFSNFGYAGRSISWIILRKLNMAFT